MARIWIDGEKNPFNLPEPPGWWQTLVSDYDKMLRLLPSQKDRVYRLGRLVRQSARLGLTAMKEVHKHPDTVMMIRHGLVPVSTVMPWAIYSSKILRDLKARDTWAVLPNQRAFEQYMKDLEADEDQAAARKQALADAELDARSSEGFRFMQAQNGERISLNDAGRGRRGKTFGTDRTRVQVASGRPSTVISSHQAAPGGPIGKSTGPSHSIVLTDAR